MTVQETPELLDLQEEKREIYETLLRDIGSIFDNLEQRLKCASKTVNHVIFSKEKGKIYECYFQKGRWTNGKEMEIIINDKKTQIRLDLDKGIGETILEKGDDGQFVLKRINGSENIKDLGIVRDYENDVVRRIFKIWQSFCIRHEITTEEIESYKKVNLILDLIKQVLINIKGIFEMEDSEEERRQMRIKLRRYCGVSF